MSSKSRRGSAEWQWEEALIDAYHDYYWEQVLYPLYEKFQRWKAGELSHDEMSNAIHETHRATQKVFTFFTGKRETLVRMIKFDTDWFAGWVKDHPEPREDSRSTDAL